ncbi:acetyl xylanesterase (cutinase) [Colletotrichum musicola]|uniref:Acetyl xylanesterase (Cutinase) n=1 Tax=Colletotrichum musicola TaxID=2175873 RepID=A0A8H6JS93_9PEZI|nr:acetyl xylanesterase (cutinase) [Colletotrichum musicola]
MHHLALAASLLAPLALAQQSPPCATVNIVVARGSLEAQGAGLLGNLANQTAAQIPGSVITPLVYPAQLDPYPPSVSAGTRNMTDLLVQQVRSCPQTKLVLMGYSQVSLDTVCGTHDGSNFNVTEAQFPTVGSLSKEFPASPHASIVVLTKGLVSAVVLFGDPTYVANQTYAKGTSTKNGIFPRTDFSACQQLTNRIASYCDETDLFCASGQNLTTHLGYFQNQRYITEAAAFAAQMSRQK